MNQFLKYHHQTLQTFAKQNSFKYLALFGSHARGEDTSGSDVDLLVEYKPGTSLLDVIGMEMELSEKIGKKVALVSRKYLNKYIKPHVEKDLIPIYVQR